MATSAKDFSKTTDETIGRLVKIDHHSNEMYAKNTLLTFVNILTVTSHQSSWSGRFIIWSASVERVSK